MLKASQPFPTPSEADLATLAAVIRDVCRLHRLSDADAQDFAQTVHLRLIERRYDAFARFDGRSSLRSYLTVVVTRLLLDWRNAIYGKWRPSAAARRLGPAGIELDRLINRDGYTPDEAAEVLRRRMRAPTAHVRELADRVPRRGRRRFVDDNVLRGSAMEGFQDPIEAREERTAARRSSYALARACRQLPADDRRLIALRYQRSMTVQQIGMVLHMNPKLLYRRFDRTLRRLRAALDAAGIHIADCRSAIAD